VPNGHNLNPDKEITKADLKIDGKVIGYLGNIRDWIDFDLIEKLLESLNETEYLLFIGPVEKNISGRINMLKENSRFRHIPVVAYPEIFSYIKSFDIGIIPFKVNKFTEGVLPNKFFEYIASGIPIVTTALPDLLQFKDIINVAKNDDEFVYMCSGKNSKLNRDEFEYKKIKNESTWEMRVNFIEDKLKKLLAIN
jgi:glycosyltransferase involved in cell wall biosynthesis